MLDRLGSILKIVCVVLAALLLFRFTRAAARKNPLDQLNIPTALSAAGGSNTLSAVKGTNTLGTNTVATNTVGASAVRTNTGGTNAVGTNAVPTNAVVANATKTNAVGTNAAPNQEIGKKATNAPQPSRTPNLGSRGMNVGPRPEMGRMAPELPPAVQTRVERITQSEILGPVMRPLPMALLGIGGKDVFLRAPNGQTGLIREGEELGGVKLLKIGTNRVLIEHEGRQQELMLFSGFGSETLLPKGKENLK